MTIADPRADEKTLWVQAKRAVLAILRVQPAKDLVEALMMPVTRDHEAIWVEIIENEMINNHKQQNRRMPSQANAEYRLEDVREYVLSAHYALLLLVLIIPIYRLPFREVKAHAIQYLLELEKLGRITRDDGYQGILNAIAGDVRSKHRKRLQRQQERASMADALKTLGERKKGYEEQIKSYNDYVEGAMKTMQKSGKGFVFLSPLYKGRRLILRRAQLEAVHHALHQAVLPSPRPTKVGQAAAVRLVQVQRARLIRQGHPALDRPVLAAAVRQARHYHLVQPGWRVYYGGPEQCARDHEPHGDDGPAHGGPPAGAVRQ
jgi:hypothetical protein